MFQTDSGKVLKKLTVAGNLATKPFRSQSHWRIQWRRVQARGWNTLLAWIPAQTQLLHICATHSCIKPLRIIIFCFAVFLVTLPPGQKSFNLQVLNRCMKCQKHIILAQSSCPFGCVNKVSFLSRHLRCKYDDLFFFLMRHFSFTLACSDESGLLGCL